MSSLPDVLTVTVSLGGVLGAVAGFAIRPRSHRELAENVVAGAQIGAVVGGGFGWVWWIGGLAGGG